MPAESVKQQEMMGAELERKRKGLPTRTKMSEGQLEDFARTKHKGLPQRKEKSRDASKR